MDTPSLIAILIILVAMSAYFSATETAFTSLNRIRLKSRAEDGDKRAEATLRLAEEYDQLLSTILIGNNIVNITASTIGTVLFTRLFLDYGPLVSTIVLTVAILIFGEISPKSLAKESPEAFARFATPLLRVLMVVFKPLNLLFSLWKKLLKKVFRSTEDDGITEEELITMVSEAESEGGLDEHESELIRSAIEFNDMDVDEILTPRVDVVAVEDTATMDEVAAHFAESGYSRLPVYHDTIDNIIGVLHEKDFYACRYRGMDSFQEMLGKVIATTGSTKISQLLRVLQPRARLRQGRHMPGQGRRERPARTRPRAWLRLPQLLPHKRGCSALLYTSSSVTSLMEIKRSSLMGLPSESATMAITIAASRGSVL